MCSLRLTKLVHFLVNFINLAKALKMNGMDSNLLGPWTSGSGSQYYCLTIKEETIYGRRTSTAPNGPSARIEED